MERIENPRGCHLWGFLARYGELFRSGCRCLFISIQPFADIVANYTCSDRDKESYYVLHGTHLLSAGGSTAYLSYHTFLPVSTAFSIKSRF